MWLNEESLFNKKRNYSSLAEVPNEELTTKSAFETLELTTQRDYTNCCYYYFFNFLNIPSISVYHLDFTFWTLIILPFRFNIIFLVIICDELLHARSSDAKSTTSHLVAIPTSSLCRWTEHSWGRLLFTDKAFSVRTSTWVFLQRALYSLLMCP